MYDHHMLVTDAVGDDAPGLWPETVTPRNYRQLNTLWSNGSVHTVHPDTTETTIVAQHNKHWNPRRLPLLSAVTSELHVPRRNSVALG